jgi:hypothetical protein
MKTLLWPAGLILLGVFALVLYQSSMDSVDVKNEDYYLKFKTDYGIYSPPIPETLDFAGEDVPLNIFYVNEKLEREILVNTYWHSNTLLMFKRAARWFPVIEPILKRNGIPDDFKYLSLVESSFSNVTSPAGAKGFWQLMKSTAVEYGLEVNRQIDERYHVEKATEAACKYLSDAHKIFGNWTLVAAAYNMGMGGVRKQVDIQKASTYYDMSLNSETSRYVYRILAVKTIFSNPKAYGFRLRQKDLFPPLKYTTVTVDTTIADLAAFVKSYDISYKMLKELNPWMLTYYLPDASHKKYEIKIPAKEMMNYRELRKRGDEKVGIFGDLK